MDSNRVVEIIMNSNEFVYKAIENTKTILPEYWQNIIRVPIVKGSNGGYCQFSTPKQLEVALEKADWYEVPNNHFDAKLFKATIPGHSDIYRIQDLPEGAILGVVSPEGTERIHVTVSGVPGPNVKETFLIIGKYKEVDVVFEVKPGRFFAHPSVLFIPLN